MTRELDRPLWQAAASTFELLGFLLAEPEDEAGDEAEEDGAAPDRSPMVSAAVDFDGPRTGRLELHTSAGVAVDVTATMLALEPPVDDALVADTLGELSNVICGNVLPAVAGPGAEFRLRRPRTGGDVGERDGAAVAAEACMRLGDGRACVRLLLVDPVAEPVP